MNVIYKIENKINSKYFIGYYCGKDISITKIRPGNLIRNDIKNLGKENFKYSLLYEFDNKEILLKKYKEIINRDFLLNPLTYNNKCVNRLTVKDNKGNTFYVYKNDYNLLNKNYIPINKKQFRKKDQRVYYSKYGEKFIIDKKDSRIGKELKKKKDWNLNKENKYLNNLKKQYSNLNLELYNKNNYLLKNYCNHYPSIIINKNDLKFRYNNIHYNNFLCDKCLDDYIKNTINEKNINYYKTILNTLFLNQLSKKYLKKHYPILYYLIDNFNSNIINFKEKIYLFKYDLKSPPKCILDNCNENVKFSNSINKYNLYCKSHSYFSTLKSVEENEIINFIKENYKGNIIQNDRNVIKGELDIYIPEFKLAIEFNGLYWHSELFKDKQYHYNKWKQCKEKGIQLITIWDDEWKYKKDIIKSIILNKLEKLINEIDIKECIIKNTSLEESKEFLNNNHIEGFIEFSINLGLYYNNELVSLMLFNNNKEGYELLRFCNKLNINIEDSEIKLFNYFIKHNKFDKIISYLNCDIDNEEIYFKLGFKEIKHYTNYWYANNKNRILKNNNKFYKVYGSGKVKFIYN